MKFVEGGRAFVQGRRVTAIILLVIALTFAPLLGQGGQGRGVLGSLQVRPASAASATRTFTVNITSNGFDDGSLNLTVNQGDTVVIKFVLDASQRADTDPSNYHIISISGYNVQTAEISPSNPSAEVTFVADTLGAFTIQCDTPECPIHYLMLSGQLTVEAPSATTSATQTVSTGPTGTTSSHSAATSATSTAAPPTLHSTTTTSPSETAQTSSQTMQPAASAGLSFGGLGELAILALALAFLVGVVVAAKFVVTSK